MSIVNDNRVKHVSTNNVFKIYYCEGSRYAEIEIYEQRMKRLSLMLMSTCSMVVMNIHIIWHIFSWDSPIAPLTIFKIEVKIFPKRGPFPIRFKT